MLADMYVYFRNNFFSVCALKIKGGVYYFANYFLVFQCGLLF